MEENRKTLYYLANNYLPTNYDTTGRSFIKFESFVCYEVKRADLVGLKGVHTKTLHSLADDNLDIIVTF